MRPCRATRAGTQAPPLPISPKPRGVPIPHRGYTFESAGLASATQPTLGNNASEEATPLGGVLFLIAHHYHTRRMNDFPTREFKKVQCRRHRFPPGDFTQGRFRCAQSTLRYQKYNTYGVDSCAPFSPTNKQNRPCAIHPNETRKQSTHTSGAEMHRALPPPFLK